MSSDSYSSPPHPITTPPAVLAKPETQDAPSKPCKPRTTYDYFMSFVMPDSKVVDPSISHDEVLYVASYVWKTATSDYLKPFQLQSEQDRMRYEMELEEAEHEESSKGSGSPSNINAS